MKHGERAEFSAKWWKDSQPDGLKSAHRLEDALHDYDTVKHTLETHATDAAFKNALGALTAIETALKAVITEAARAKGPEMDATAASLRKLDVDKERAWVESKGKKDDDEEDDSPFGADKYPIYLLKMLRRLRTVPMNFSLVLGHKPDEHRLCLNRIAAPLTLGHRLIQETGLHLMTYGTVTPDDNKAQTILLTIEGRQLPGVKKKMERMFRFHRPLPFQYVTLYVGGAEIEDVDDPDDHEIDLPNEEDHGTPHESELLAEMGRIRPRLTAAMAGSPETRRIIMSEVERFVSRLKAGDLSGARAGIVSLNALIPGQGFSPILAEPVASKDPRL